MKKFLFSCAMLAVAAWAVNAQNEAQKIQLHVDSIKYNFKAGLAGDTQWEYLIDGDTTTSIWTNEPALQGHNIQVNLDNSYYIDNIALTLVWKDDKINDAPNHTIFQYFDTQWNDLEGSEINDEKLAGLSETNLTLWFKGNGVMANGIRLVFQKDTGKWLNLAELSIYGREVSPSTPTALSATQASDIRAFVSGNSLRVSGVPAGETIRVYTINSVLVASAVATQGVTELAVPAQGVLIVRAGNEVIKVIK